MTLATWQHTRRTGAAAHSEEDFDPEIKLFKLNTAASGYEQNHPRVPDLSADIRVKFPAEEYIGVYVSHGWSKTVFEIKSAYHKRADLMALC